MSIAAANSAQEDSDGAHHDWVIAATVTLCAACNALWEDGSKTRCPGGEVSRQA